MRISDWSSDVCSSDLAAAANLRVTRVLAISDGGQGGYMPQMADMEARIAAPPTVVPQAAPPVMAGTNMNIVTVRVDFAPAAKRSGMAWFSQLGRAIRHLARPAPYKPLWPIKALNLSSPPLTPHLFSTALLFLLV